MTKVQSQMDMQAEIDKFLTQGGTIKKLPMIVTPEVKKALRPADYEAVKEQNRILGHSPKFPTKHSERDQASLPEPKGDTQSGTTSGVVEGREPLEAGVIASVASGELPWEEQNDSAESEADPREVLRIEGNPHTEESPSDPWVGIDYGTDLGHIEERVSASLTVDEANTMLKNEPIEDPEGLARHERRGGTVTGRWTSKDSNISQEPREDTTKKPVD